MQALRPITEKIFIGMNDKYPSHLLPPGVFALLQNVIIDSNSITKRPGTTAIASSIGAHAILGVTDYEPVAGTKYLIASLDGGANAQLYSWTGTGNFSSIGSANLLAGARMNFTQASNVLCGFNGTDAVQVNSSLTVTKNPSTVPQGLCSQWFHNYLFVGGVATTPSRLYWSNLGDPTTFDPANFIDINPNDGDSITGMAVFNDELYVFKNNTIWSISGFSGSTFSSTTASGQNTNSKIFGYGTPAHQSIVVTGKDMYYLSYSGGIPHIRSFTQTIFATSLEQGIVSYDIENTLKGVSKTSLAKTSAVFDGKYIYWSMPSGGSSTNNLVVVLQPSVTDSSAFGKLHCWVKWTGINASIFALSDISGQDTIYFGDATTGGFVFQLNGATFTDNGTNVVMDARPRLLSLDAARKSKFKYLYFSYTTGSAGTLQIGASIDNAASFTSQENVSLVGNSPGLGSFILGTSVLGGQSLATHRTTFKQLTGHRLALQFLESTSNSCQIFDFETLAIPKGYRAS